MAESRILWRGLAVSAILLVVGISAVYIFQNEVRVAKQDTVQVDKRGFFNWFKGLFHGKSKVPAVTTTPTPVTVVPGAGKASGTNPNNQTNFAVEMVLVNTTRNATTFVLVTATGVINRTKTAPSVTSTITHAQTSQTPTTKNGQATLPPNPTSTAVKTGHHVVSHNLDEQAKSWQGKKHKHNPYTPPKSKKKPAVPFWYKNYLKTHIHNRPIHHTYMKPHVAPVPKKHLACSAPNFQMQNLCPLTKYERMKCGSTITYVDMKHMVFSDHVVEELLRYCPPGTWCLKTPFAQNILQKIEQHPWPLHHCCGLHQCLEAMPKPCLNTNRTLVAKGLHVACHVLWGPNHRPTCTRALSKMLHITIADQIRRQHGNKETCDYFNMDPCLKSCQKVAHELYSMSKQCLGNWFHLQEFPAWRYFFQHKYTLLYSVCNMRHPQQHFPHGTPQPRKNSTIMEIFHNISQHDKQVVTGIIAASAVSLVGFVVIIWACSKRYGARRSKIGYSEINAYQFDTPTRL